MILSTEEMEIGPLFADWLFREEKVPTPSFSFGMVGYTADEPSFIDFGEPDADRIEGGVITQDNTVTLGFNDDFFWSTYI